MKIASCHTLRNATHNVALERFSIETLNSRKSFAILFEPFEIESDTVK